VIIRHSFVIQCQSGSDHSCFVITAIFFAIGKWALGLYLGSGTAASAYGAASSLITLLLWSYYSSRILLFGAEFTQVYASRAGRAFVPDKYAVRV
jgi:membrane protein